MGKTMARNSQGDVSLSGSDDARNCEYDTFTAHKRVAYFDCKRREEEPFGVIKIDSGNPNPNNSCNY
jgi:hypothetical protein